MTDPRPQLRARYEQLAQRLRQRGHVDLPRFPEDQDLQAMVNVNQRLRAYLELNERPVCVTVKQDVWRVPMKVRPADEFTRPLARRKLH